MPCASASPLVPLPGLWFSGPKRPGLSSSPVATSQERVALLPSAQCFGELPSGPPYLVGLPGTAARERRGRSFLRPSVSGVGRAGRSPSPAGENQRKLSAGRSSAGGQTSLAEALMVGVPGSLQPVTRTSSRRRPVAVDSLEGVRPSTLSVHLEAQPKRLEDLCPLPPNSSYRCSEDRVLPHRWHSQCQGPGG